MKRWLGSLITFVVIALVSVACAGTDARNNEEGIKITFQFTGEAEEAAVYRTLVAAFEKDHPDIDVKPVPIGDKDEHLQKLTASAAAGALPEVFLLNFREYAQFVVRGAVEPVEPFIEDAGIDLGAYYEQPVEAFTYDGRLQCMPQNVSSLVVYYNADLFERAGLEHPERWTWAQFRDYALELSRLGDDIDGVGIEPGVIRVAPFVWSNGGDIVDDLEQPTRFTLDEPEALEALRFLVDLVREDATVPTEEEIAAQDLETRFSTGKLGMFLSSRRATPVFRENLQLNWDVAPLPVAGEQAGILHSDAYCVAAGADNIDEVMEFVAFATGEEGATITALGGRTVPSLRSVAESGAFLNPAQPPAHSEVFLDAVPFLQRTPVIPTWPEIEDIAEEIFTQMFYEPGYTIEQAISDLNAQAAPLFEEGGSP